MRHDSEEMNAVEKMRSIVNSQFFKAAGLFFQPLFCIANSNRVIPSKLERHGGIPPRTENFLHCFQMGCRCIVVYLPAGLWHWGSIVNSRLQRVNMIDLCSPSCKACQ